jgi:pimeloyl-ACP methyl ester carboxylesterase
MVVHGQFADHTGRGHAVVLGASMGGLLAARILSD